MKFDIISITATTITIEVLNDEKVYSREGLVLYLNNSPVLESKNNVTTLFNLKPQTQYQLYIKNAVTNEVSSTATFKTSEEALVLNVRDFGAVGNGKNYDTAAIQAAIMACPKGGRVIVPEGSYLTAPLFLKSHITLELKRGAELLGSSERLDYPILPGIIKNSMDEEYYLGTWEGEAVDCFASLITGIGVEEVVITGEGCINGNASHENWWHKAKEKRIAWRPRLVFLRDCRDMTIEGITLKNSPSWTLHPVFSKNLNFINLKLINPKDSPNTDGINPESCSDVLILGVDFSVGDDCIAIKSGKLYLGRKLKTPSENIFIRNCHMKFGHGAIVLGSEMSGGIKNVFASRCIFQETDRGIRIKTRRGRGKDAVIDGIYAEEILMKGVLTPFVINAFYFCDEDGKTEYVWSKEKLPVDEGTPTIKNIAYKNIECVDSEVAAGFFYGLPERKIEGLSLENITVSFSEAARPDYPAMMSFLDKRVKAGFFIGNAINVTIKKVSIDGAAEAAFRFEGVENLDY